MGANYTISYECAVIKSADNLKLKPQYLPNVWFCLFVLIKHDINIHTGKVCIYRANRDELLLNIILLVWHACSTALKKNNTRAAPQYYRHLGLYACTGVRF
jgi:hypothetical protein